MKQVAHFLFFLLTLAWLSLLLFYQVFVNSRYQRIPFQQFIKPDTLAQAVSTLIFHPSLPKKPELIKETIKVEVDCQEFCQFNLIDLKNGSLIKTLPAREDFNPAGRLKKLTLAFTDSQSSLIGYEGKALTDRTFYVINFEAELIQVVKLSLNNQLNFEFIDYYPSTQQMLFKSFNASNNKEEFWLYAANRPALQLL